MSQNSELQVLAANSKSFSFASRWLPPQCRLDAAIVYTFCRVVDDVVDERADDDSAREALQSIRQQLNGKAEPSQFVARFLQAAQRRNMDLQFAHALVDGVELDMDTVRIADDAALLRYAYGVAGTIGLMMCSVIGVENKSAYWHAIDLGLGMQLTNICRDVREDALMGRVYLPASRLASRGISQDHIVGAYRRDKELSVELSDSLTQVVLELLDLADRYYESAQDGMRAIPWKPRAGIMVASRVYRAIGEKIRLDPAESLKSRTVVSKLSKIYLALTAMLSKPMRTAQCAPGDLLGHGTQLHSALVGLPGCHTIGVIADNR